MSAVEELVVPGVGILFMLLAIPMIARRVAPNPWYGVRTTETLGDESVWYDANAKSGWGFLILGAVLTVIALTTESMPLWTGAALIGTLAWAAWSGRLARSLQEKREGRHGGS